jgi:integrase
MPHPTTKKPLEKPSKPYRTFPLYAHATKRWAKKIAGKTHFFGPWDKPDEALQEYLRIREDLEAGRRPGRQRAGVSVAEVCNEYLAHKLSKIDSGELSSRSWRDYHATCERIVKGFGKTTNVSVLVPDDFAELRSSIAKTRGPVSLANELTRIRSVFKFAYESGRIDTPVRFGHGLERPSKKSMRQAKHARGSRLFTDADLRKIIAHADNPMRAMVLLAINGGLGQSDISGLPKPAVDLKESWLDYPRVKTTIERRIPLWPETVRALREAIEKRPAPANPEDDRLVFLTRFGVPWVRSSLKSNNQDELQKLKNPIRLVDAIAGEFKKLVAEIEIEGSFYNLRHSFATVGADTRDQVAVNAIMGHADQSIAANYRERISDDRLKAVTDHVRTWLFSDQPKKRSTKQK